jgi:hypothetical protein
MNFSCVSSSGLYWLEARCACNLRACTWEGERERQEEIESSLGIFAEQQICHDGVWGGGGVGKTSDEGQGLGRSFVMLECEPLFSV